MTLDEVRRQNGRFFSLRATSPVSLHIDYGPAGRGAGFLTATLDLFATDDDVTDPRAARRLRDTLTVD